MSTDYDGSLKDELGRVAGHHGMKPDAAVVAIQAAKGKVVRRRVLMLTLPLGTVLVGAVAGQSLIKKWIREDVPIAVQTATPTPTQTSVSISKPPEVGDARVPFVRKGILHVGGKSIPVPSGWAVNSILSATGRVVLNVSTGPDTSGVAVLSADGVLRLIPNAVGAKDISRDGQRLLASLRGASIPTDSRQVWPESVVYRLEDLAISARASLDGLSPVRFLGPLSETALMISRGSAYSEWIPGQGDTVLRKFPGNGYPIDLDATGKNWISGSTETGMVYRLSRDLTVQAWSIKVPELVDGAFSSDGSSIVLSTESSVSVIDSKSGVALGDMQGIAVGSWRLLAWEDADTILMTDDRFSTRDLYRCRVSDRKCGALPDRVVASRSR